MAERATPRVKGISFRSVTRAVEALHGSSTMEQCLAIMPSELASAFKYQAIVASSWYSIEWYRELLKSVQTVMHFGERGLFEIGRQCARQDMTGIYRLGFKLLSPEVVLQLSTRLFSNYYDTGKSTVLQSRSGFAHVRWFDCVGFDKNMWWEAFGAAEMFMELSGGKSVRTRIVRGGNDVDEMAELTMHWTI